MKSCIVVILVVASIVQAEDLLKYSRNNIDVISKKTAVPEVRIVGGNEATPHSFPYAAAVYMDGKYICGGSIITKDVILTAAHCVASVKSVTIISGAHNLNNNESTQQNRTSTTFFVHENYNPDDITNDIALIRLNSPLNLNDFVKVVQIDEGDCLGPRLDRSQGTVAGWGRFGRVGAISSPVLRFVTNGILTNTECKTWFSVIQNKNICLSGSDRKGTCNGDGGSALIVTKNGKRVEVGLSSFGTPLGCDIRFPSVFTRVACYKDWIKNKL